MIDGKNFFGQTVTSDRRTCEKMRQVKDMITQLAVYCVMFISKVIIKL